MMTILLSYGCLGGSPEVQWDFSHPDNRPGCKLVAWSAEKKLQFPLHRPFEQCQPEPTAKGLCMHAYFHDWVILIYTASHVLSSSKPAQGGNQGNQKRNWST